MKRCGKTLASLLYETAIARVVNLLLHEYKPTDFGHLTTETINYRMLQPIATQGSIRGTIISIDNFGNAIANVTKDLFCKAISADKALYPLW